MVLFFLDIGGSFVVFLYISYFELRFLASNDGWTIAMYGRTNTEFDSSAGKPENACSVTPVTAAASHRIALLHGLTVLLLVLIIIVAG
jgi:hypothetical protein